MRIAGTPAAQAAALAVVLTGSIGFAFSAWHQSFELMFASGAYTNVGLYCLYGKKPKAPSNGEDL